jgi:hypothetical protein
LVVVVVVVVVLLLLLPHEAVDDLGRCHERNEIARSRGL